MALTLSAPKTVLLAVELAAKTDIDGLAFLASQQGTVLRKDLLLRILLTYLPETLPSSEYASFLLEIESSQYTHLGNANIDTSTVEELSDEEAARRVRKLHLLSLALRDSPEEVRDDPITLFLLSRAYKVDDEAGLLDQLLDLVVPFLEHSAYLRTWMVSVLLPLLRRNCEYHPQQGVSQALLSFERSPDRVAVDWLLSETGVREDGLANIGRDLRGLIGPWLFSDIRWKRNKNGALGVDGDAGALQDTEEGSPCPGWDQVLEWLVSQAAKSWRVAVAAVEQWEGPQDVDLGGYAEPRSDEDEQQYMARSYARAALAAAYMIPESSTEALNGAYSIVSKVKTLLDLDGAPPIHTAASLLHAIPELQGTSIISARNATFLRNNYLAQENPLTAPSEISIQLLNGLVLSAFILTRAGAPCTVRRVGELFLLQDEREQKAEALKVIHALTNNGPKSEDRFWERARNELLWLRDWGVQEDAESEEAPYGIFTKVKREFLEVEVLKALLVNTRYTLARTIYEDRPEKSLPRKLLQDTIFAAAMNAYDNASSPSRARGGVKKCDEIIHAFPKTIERSMIATQRIEALLRATHSLSDYRLVLKQGEPFTPVLLRVHSDPVSIIAKVLEQNPKSYTSIQDLLDLGSNMVEAGLTVKDKAGHSALTPEQEPNQRAVAERRITAMCIDAALTEDDFETAYSYVVNRLAAFSPASQQTKRKASTASNLSLSQAARQPPLLVDDWSWKAALQAGKYRRTARTLRFAHHGTGISANPDIRHLEQRIECLATALRIAPAPTLQEILNAFRRCEEELDAAVKAEAEQDDAWDAAGDVGVASLGRSSTMPGGFGGGPTPPLSRAATAVAAKRAAGRGGTSAEDTAPMSLFDLSRASARAAQRNFTALSNLQQSVMARVPGGGPTTTQVHLDSGSGGEGEDGQPKRARKRDQLREAAMGAMVSGVGWLVGAQPVDQDRERE